MAALTTGWAVVDADDNQKIRRIVDTEKIAHEARGVYASNLMPSEVIEVAVIPMEEYKELLEASTIIPGLCELADRGLTKENGE